MSDSAKTRQKQEKVPGTSSGSPSNADGNPVGCNVTADRPTARSAYHTSRSRLFPIMQFTMLLALAIIAASPRISSAAVVCLKGLEVTQAIQEITDTDPFLNSVPLIARKKTVVRAYFKLRVPWWDPFTMVSPPTLTTTATLKGRHSNGLTKELQPKNSDTVTVASRSGTLQEIRRILNMSLNFELPPDWISEGSLTLSIVNVKDTSGNTIGSEQYCDNNVTTVQFHPSAEFRVRLISLGYSMGGIRHLPRWKDLSLISYWLQRAYPIAEGYLHISHRSDEMPDQNEFPASFSCNTANVTIQNLYSTAVFGQEGLDARTRFIGLIADDYRPSDKAFEGCANTTDGVIDYSDPASVPTGPVIPDTWPSYGDARAGTTGWDEDGSYADWYTGHELGHLLGLHHLPFPAATPPEGSYDPYPYPNGQLSNSGSHMGFDTGGIARWPPQIPTARAAPFAHRGGVLLPPFLGRVMKPKPMPGAEWYDVMTYCPKQWISDVTYKRIRCQISNEDGFNDPDCAPSHAQAPAARSYAGWPAIQPQQMIAQPVAMTPYNHFGLGSGRANPPGRKTQKPQLDIKPGDFVDIIATIDFDDVTKSKIKFVSRFDKGLITPQAQDSSVIVRLEGYDGTVKETHVAVKQSTKRRGEKIRSGLAHAMIRIPEGFSLKRLSLLVKREGEETPIEVDSREIGQQSPQFRSSSTALELGVVSDRKKLNGQTPYRYAWSAEDPDKDKLSFTVLISTDNGTTWQTVAANVSSSSLTITEAHARDLGIALPATVLIKVIASDGFNRTEQEGELALSR